MPWSLASLLGALYVLEGSTLGGQVIARRLNHIIGHDGVVATRYLNAYQAQTLTQWQVLRQLLDDVGHAHPQMADLVVLGAMATFLRIHQSLHAICA